MMQLEFQRELAARQASVHSTEEALLFAVVHVQDSELSNLNAIHQ